MRAAQRININRESKVCVVSSRAFGRKLSLLELVEISLFLSLLRKYTVWKDVANFLVLVHWNAIYEWFCSKSKLWEKVAVNVFINKKKRVVVATNRRRARTSSNNVCANTNILSLERNYDILTHFLSDIYSSYFFIG